MRAVVRGNPKAAGARWHDAHTKIQSPVLEQILKQIKVSEGKNMRDRDSSQLSMAFLFSSLVFICSYLARLVNAGGAGRIFH